MSSRIVISVVGGLIPRIRVMMNRGGGRMRWRMLYTSRLSRSRICHCGIATTVMAKYLVSLLGGMHKSSCVWTMWSIVRLRRLVIISAIIVPLIVPVVIALGGRVTIIWVVVRLVRW